MREICRTLVACRRAHHLIKTFYAGPGGWTDQQMPDGTIVLTAPTGHTYTTEPHGASMFPHSVRTPVSWTSRRT